MGAWGVKISQDDLYADIKDYYTACIRCGMSDEEAYKYVLKEFENSINDVEDGELFWMSFADILWKLGRLNDKTKNKALECINNTGNLAKWYEISEDSGNERKKEIEELRKQLISEQPLMKKIGKKRFKKCSWSDGDIFRYKFKDEIAKKYGFDNKYLILQKIDQLFIPDADTQILKNVLDNKRQSECGDIFPVIHFWITDDINFIPSEKDRNDCIPTLGTKTKHQPHDFRFYILDLPGKCDQFEFICNSEIIIPDKEDITNIKETNEQPFHLTWKFFEKHVIGRFLFWEKDINIYNSK